MKTNTLSAFCHACHVRIRFAEQPELYDIIICPECDEAFEVINLSPLRLDWPSDFDEEWSDAGYDDKLFDD